MKAWGRNSAFNGTKIIQVACVVCSLLFVTLTRSANDDRTRAGGPANQSGTNLPPVEQNYPFVNGHWVSLVMDWGVKVKLEDGSVWEIASKDQSKTRNWMVAQKISVNEYPNDRYPFRLTNTDQKESADARLVSRLRP